VASEHRLGFDTFNSTDPDPWHQIRRDRERCPVVHVEAANGFSFLQVGTYDLVREVLRQPEVFSNRMGVIPRGAEGDEEQVLEFADPPEHTIHRALIGKAFSAARVNERHARIQAVADDLVDEIAEAGNGFQLRARFGRQLPSRIISEILGVPEEDRARFIEWSEIGEAAVGQIEPDPGTVEAQEAFLEYCRKCLRDRLNSPRDDLLSTIIHAQQDGQRFTETEAAAMVRLLLAAGNGTTSIGISNLVYLLETNPDEKRRLLADMDGLIASAVEEGFRYDCPVQGNLRGVLRETEVGGHKLMPGDRAYLFYTSANHDPAHYDEPDRFRIDRDWTREARHYAFGFGIHFCLGAELARAETQIAIRTLYTRLPNLRMKAGFRPQQVPGMVFRTWAEIEMEYDGAPLPRLSESSGAA